MQTELNFIGYNKLFGGNFIANIPNTTKSIFQHDILDGVEYFLTNRAYYVDTKNVNLDPSESKLRYHSMTNSRSSYGVLYDIYVSDGVNFHRVLNTSFDNILGNVERAVKTMKSCSQTEIDKVTESARKIK